MRKPDHEAEVTAELKRETDGAYLISDGDNEVWVAKSLCEWDGRQTFTMPEWKAMELGLI